MLVVDRPVAERTCENPTCRNALPLEQSRGRPKRWCSDRCRKTQYAGICVDCGGPTDGASRGGVAKRCRSCRHDYERTAAIWTHATVVAAIRRWHTETGYTPSAREWRRRGSYWPPSATVRALFGSWNMAIAAAGFAIRTIGQRTGRKNPTWDTERIIAALQAWAAEHGRSPAANDWKRANANEHPAGSTVVKRFGSWNAGLMAAGLPCRARVGGPPKRNAPRAYE